MLKTAATTQQNNIHHQSSARVDLPLKSK